jgi:hypothetical protein
MPDRKTIGNATVFALIWMASAVLLIAFAMATTVPRPAMANPNIATSTGLPCAKCHTAAPALNSYGKKYKEGQKK